MDVFVPTWNFWRSIRLVVVASFSFAATSLIAQEAQKVTIHWDKPLVVSKTIATLQVVVNPPLRPGEPLGAASYKAVNELGADYVRYVPWLPYPRLAVAELEPPTPQKTSWDFTLIDPMTKDFLAAPKGTRRSSTSARVRRGSTRPTIL